jgi:hypothetical protein
MLRARVGSNISYKSSQSRGCIQGNPFVLTTVRGSNSQDFNPVVVRTRMPAMTSRFTPCEDVKREKCVEA